MRKTFVEIIEFTNWITEYLSDEEYIVLQRMLLDDPERGDVMPGCGGLRKLRIADNRRGKGKRGGIRVVYLHVQEAGRIYFLDIYGKDEKDDLTAQEKKVLKLLGEQLKKEATRNIPWSGRKRYS